MILSCGEAVIDFMPISGEIKGYQPRPGGSPYNIAIAMARLKTPAGFLGRLSTDFFGDLLVNHLVTNGVDIRYLIRAQGLTTLGIVNLPSQAQEPEFLLYANDSVDRHLKLAELPNQFSNEIKVLHFGSISLAMDPSASCLTALMARESKQRILSLDPNIRPNVIADKSTYLRRLETWIQWVDIVKLSRADMHWLYPDNEPEILLKQWVKQGLSLGILTLGREGSLGYTATGEKAFATAPEIQIKDTVGAGDSFLAAVLSYLEKRQYLAERDSLRAISGHELTSCLEYAAKAAAINCSRVGVDPAWKEELLEE